MMAPPKLLHKKKNGAPKFLAAAAPPPRFFYPSISKLAVAQICRSIGYTTFSPSALDSLSDIASKYIQSLAHSAASIANSRNRTQSNLLDVVLSIERHSSPHGFPGASNATKPVLKSATLKQLIAFVKLVDEVPFAVPIKRRECGGGTVSVTAKTFGEVGREPPLPHVPNWLPCFPEMEGEKGREREKDKRRWEEMGNEDDFCEKGQIIEFGKRNEISSEKDRGVWWSFGEVPLPPMMPCFMRERKKVRFKLMKGGVCNAENIKKRKLIQ